MAKIDTMLGEFRSAAAERFVLGRGSIHGPAHWDAVERNVVSICAGSAVEDTLTCRVFAIFHDCERANEGFDPDHGRRAADYVMESHEGVVREWVGDDRFERLVTALRLHNDGQISDDPIIGACWDADRLELPRVGITPALQFFSTEPGKELARRIARLEQRRRANHALGH